MDNKMNHPLSDLMRSTMEKVHEMVDTNTIIGQPITTPDGVTLIPISKVSLGFGGGGGDYGKGTKENFGGGAMRASFRQRPANTDSSFSCFPAFSGVSISTRKSGSANSGIMPFCSRCSASSKPVYPYAFAEIVIFSGSSAGMV